MKKSVYTREQIERLYEDVMRRFRNQAYLGGFSTPSEIIDLKIQMFQRIYYFLLATSANSRECIHWCTEMELKFL